MSKGQTLCRLIAVFLIFAQAGVLATRSAAQDEARENSDKVLSYEDVAELTSSGALTFPGLGQSKYSDNGVYRFTDEASSITRFGFFDIQKDGRVCVDFFQGQRGQCHIFLRKNGLVFLLTEEGDRFPVTFNLNGN